MPKYKVTWWIGNSRKECDNKLGENHEPLYPKIQERINTKDRRKTMESVVMPSIILRIPESLLAELDHIADETYTSRSALIRQSIVRNLAIIRQVEYPAILAYHRSRIPKPLTEGNK